MDKQTEEFGIIAAIVLIVVVLFVMNHATTTKAAPITLVPQANVNAAVATTQLAATNAANANSVALANSPAGLITAVGTAIGTIAANTDTSDDSSS